MKIIVGMNFDLYQFVVYFFCSSDLQMIDDVIGQECAEMQMETSTSRGMEYVYPDSSPHRDTPNLGFAQLYGRIYVMCSTEIRHVWARNPN